MNSALTNINTTSSISLIPYLTPGEREFFLCLTDTGNGAQTQGSSPFFQVVSESNPFSKILHTKIHVKHKGTVEPVFLLFQKDHYAFSDVKEHLNNMDLDKNWQNAFLFYLRNRLAQPPVIIPEQVDKNGGLIPFLPLWYCRFKNVYFHPCCPVCGDPLKQCQDDELLMNSGLQPFSTTLQRYLYCPCASAHGIGNPVVFYSRKSAVDAPENLKSGDDLIVEFGMPAKQSDPAYQSPCSGCDQHASCFGTENEAFSRLAAVSFFPFYMIVFNASDAFSTALATSFSETPASRKFSSGADFYQETTPDAITLPAPDVYAAKKDIHRILKNIFQNWEKRRSDERIQSEAETVIFSAKDRVAADAVKTIGAPPGPGTGDLQRTVIIPRQKEMAGKISSGEGDLQRTMIIPRQKAIDEKATAGAGVRELEKTVIIAGKMPPAAPDEKDSANESLEKTVIIRRKALSAFDKPHKKDAT